MQRVRSEPYTSTGTSAPSPHIQVDHDHSVLVDAHVPLLVDVAGSLHHDVVLARRDVELELAPLRHGHFLAARLETDRSRDGRAVERTDEAPDLPLWQRSEKDHVDVGGLSRSHL